MKRAIDRRQFGLSGVDAAALPAAAPARAQGGPVRIRIGRVAVPDLDVKKYSALSMVEQAAKRLA